MRHPQPDGQPPCSGALPWLSGLLPYSDGCPLSYVQPQYLGGSVSWCGSVSSYGQLPYSAGCPLSNDSAWSNDSLSERDLWLRHEKVLCCVKAPNYAIAWPHAKVLRAWRVPL